jgi:Ser/Thr protein kinase RdoA (MazF antagonist)
MDKAAAERAYTPAAVAALAAFPIGPAELELVWHSENVTFRVTDRNDGAVYVLRLHRPGYHTLDELNSERVWIRALSREGIAVPVPLVARDGSDYVPVIVSGTGERRYAGMSHWTQGEVLDDVMRHIKNVGVTEGYLEQLGVIVATLHNQASGWQVPADFKRHAFDTDGLMGDAPFWGRFWDHPVLSPAERQLLLETRERIRGALDRHGRHTSTYSMIHADLHTGNLLVDGDRLTVIDFDDAGFGWHQYDIAVALFNYLTGANYAGAERAFLRGYRTTRAIAGNALALIPMFLLIRGLAIIGWIHQRPELDRSRYLVGLKDLVCAQCEAFEPPC